MTPSAITSFSGVHHFLSNFSESYIRTKRLVYPTMEHWFQAHKTENPNDRYAITQAATPKIAKAMGRSIRLRPDWEEVKLDVMRRGLARKFTPKSDLADMLLSTGDSRLIEGNRWGDDFWGAVYIGDKYVGHNWLGWLLMAQRAELRGR